MGEDVSLFTLRTTTTTPAAVGQQGTYVTTAIGLDESLISITNPTTSAPNVTVQQTQTLTSTNYTGDMFSVQTNVGLGGTYTFQQDFSVQILDEVEITLTSINVDFFAHSKDGVKQNQDMECNATLTLKKDGEVVKGFDKGKIDITFTGNQNYQGKVYNDAGQRLDAAGGVTQEYKLPQGVKLDEGNYTLTIEIERSNNDGSYFGIGNVEAKGMVSKVPEPTTGALSLLALAGLCIRRRK